jgi:hypothetical protein
MKKVLAVLAVVGACAALVNAQPEKKKDTGKPAAAPAAAQPGDKKPDMKMPEGMPEMTPEQIKEMETYMKAATPGPMHAKLQESVGTWKGSVKMWHEPNTPAQESECTTSIMSMMDGRFIHGEVDGNMMGMPFTGAFLNGYDNVSKKFQMVWVDNFGTGMMTGTGDLSADGKTLNWTMKWNDPMRGEITMREVDTFTGDTMKLEMYCPDKAGKEFKMMEINYTRTNKAAPAMKGDHGKADDHSHASPAKK